MPYFPVYAVGRPAWPDAKIPVAPRESHEIQQLGRHRVDDYAWMKFIPPTGTRTLETLPPRLRAHLTAEMAYADEILQPLAADIRWFQDRLAAGAPDLR